jgi:hypothetical protein
MGRFRLPAWGFLAALCGAKAAFLASHLHYRDLALDYPFPGGDGLEWLNNGLAWAGAPTRTTARPPVLPWIFALLDRLHALPWFPLLHQLVLPAGVLALYLTLRRWHPPWVALGACLVPLVSAAATGHGLELMADTLAAVLLFFALAAFLEADRRPRLYVAAGAVGAASALTQHAALLAPLPLAVALLVTRRDDLRRPHLWLGATLFALPCAGWFLGKAIVFGSAGDVAGRHWDSLGLQWGALPYYGAALAGLIGLPACALALWGAVDLVRHHHREARTWVALGVALTLGGFFVFLYGFRLQRLLLYVLLPLGIPLAQGLAAIRPRVLQAIAAALATTWAAWPSPGPPVIDSGYVLLPVPGVVGFASPFAPPLLRVTPDAAWRAGPLARVRAAQPLRSPGTPELDAARLGEGAVVFLHREGDPGRHATQLRLGAALHRRVQAVPEDLYPANWWGWRRTRFVGRGDRYVFFRVRLPVRQQANLVAFADDDPAWRRLRHRLAAPAARPPASSLAAIDRLSARLQALFGPGDPFVALIGEATDERVRLLPFTLTTSSLFVFTGEEARQARLQISRQPARLVSKPGEVPVLAARLWRWRVLAVMFPPTQGTSPEVSH